MKLNVETKILQLTHKEIKVINFINIILSVTFINFFLFQTKSINQKHPKAQTHRLKYSNVKLSTKKDGKINLIYPLIKNYSLHPHNPKYTNFSKIYVRSRNFFAP